MGPTEEKRIVDTLRKAFAAGVEEALKVVAETMRDWPEKQRREDTDALVDKVLVEMRDNLSRAVAVALDAAKLPALNGYIFHAIVTDGKLKWKEVDEARYDEMLGALPPASMTGYGFLVGEEWDHHPIQGHARYTAFVQIGTKFYESTRPIGYRDFRNLDVMSVEKNIEEPT